MRSDEDSSGRGAAHNVVSHRILRCHRPEIAGRIRGFRWNTHDDILQGVLLRFSPWRRFLSRQGHFVSRDISVALVNALASAASSNLFQNVFLSLHRWFQAHGKKFLPSLKAGVKVFAQPWHFAHGTTLG